MAERHSCRLFLFKVTALFSFCLLLNDIFNTVKLRMGGEKIENEWWKLLGEEDASKSSCLLHGGYGLREAKFVGPFFLYHSHLLFKCHVNESLDWDVQCVCVWGYIYLWDIKYSLFFMLIFHLVVKIITMNVTWESNSIDGSSTITYSIFLECYL